MNCRHCNADLRLQVICLGNAPPSNSYLSQAQLYAPEVTYPLEVRVCEQCWLAQTLDYARPDEIFDAEYAYFSSYSSSWLAHAEKYVVDVFGRFGLGSESHVIEVASNDGYLLQFVQARGIKCTGIEPTASTAEAARGRGIRTIQQFLTLSLAKQLLLENMDADLIVANNVLAHVPAVNDFVSAIELLLKPHGIVTFEFPHLLKLIEKNEFDTIYHEHFSYFSLSAVRAILETNKLEVFDVEELSTHGGSLRLFAQRRASGRQRISKNVEELERREVLAGIKTSAFYTSFQRKAEIIKDELLSFLIRAKREGKLVVAYGAAAKGNTLLNFSGCRADMIRYVADKNPAKRGKFLPGSHIPIVAVDQIRRDKPNYVLILPWNLSTEIERELRPMDEWGGKFVTAVPKLEISP